MLCCSSLSHSHSCKFVTDVSVPVVQAYKGCVVHHSLTVTAVSLLLMLVFLLYRHTNAVLFITLSQSQL